MLKILQILLLFAVPWCCLAQFSIKGPSDGNRQAQGLKYSADKGIEYTDKSASLGTGDFTIQGATDGHSSFQIQGPSDGNTDFQIQAPSHGGANTYLQDPYDPRQRGDSPQHRALQYQDPSGLKVNWRFGQNRQVQPQQQQQQQEQYAPQPVPQPVAQQPRRRPAHRQQQHQPARQQAPAQIQPNYTPFNSAPSQIKQLLEYQAQIPYQNAIPEPFRFDAESAAQLHAKHFQEEYPKQVQQALSDRKNVLQQAPAPAPVEAPQRHQPRGQYRAKYRAESRQKRQAPGGYQQQQQQQQQPDFSQYKRISQPAPEVLPNYSTNLPTEISSLLKYQAQIPYDIIANQISYVPDKPYVPQPVQAQQHAPQQPQQQYAPQQQQQQYAPPQQPEYVPQYAQGLAQGPNQAQGQQYGGVQAQGQYYGQQPTRPVTEQQY
ncbi:putative uncharacterized protein DDB_G0271606 [Leptopilina heterotoma]|uniref:putative uncharacterized protein DDB_G0271606 n=1 Tax=Leptopilina heterotoma TaxID=63436 RepID=UPI001CAA259D|nr:putative uncharacterized protein DDB_G0271606 [Leptopilina heterotoma]